MGNSTDCDQTDRKRCIRVERVRNRLEPPTRSNHLSRREDESTTDYCWQAGRDQSSNTSAQPLWDCTLVLDAGIECKAERPRGSGRDGNRVVPPMHSARPVSSVCVGEGPARLWWAHWPTLGPCAAARPPTCRRVGTDRSPQRPTGMSWTANSAERGLEAT